MGTCYEVWARVANEVDAHPLFRFPAESWGSKACWETLEQLFAEGVNEVTVKRIEAS